MYYDGIYKEEFKIYTASHRDICEPEKRQSLQRQPHAASGHPGRPRDGLADKQQPLPEHMGVGHPSYQ